MCMLQHAVSKRQQAESSFSKLIRDWRKRSRLSQEAVALLSLAYPENAQFSQGYLSQIESGQSEPNVHIIKALREILGIPKDELEAVFEKPARTEAVHDENEILIVPGLGKVLQWELDLLRKTLDGIRSTKYKGKEGDPSHTLRGMIETTYRLTRRKRLPND